MSLVYQIPKTSQFISTNNIFTANFNVPALGQYSFTNAGNTGQVVIPLIRSYLYFLKQITIGGTIPEEEYFFNIAIMPQIRLRYAIENQNVYRNPFPVNQYCDGLESTAWIYTEKDRDSLIMDLNVGVLNQDAFLIGTAAINIVVSLTIFEISDGGYIQNFKKPNNSTGIGARSNLSSDVKIYA